MTPELVAQREIVRRKLTKVNNFLQNSTSPEWMTQRVKHGDSKATVYIISEALAEVDFMTFAKNAAKVAKMNQTLRLKAAELQSLLDSLGPRYGYVLGQEEPESDFRKLTENNIIRNYLAVTPDLKRQVVLPFLESPAAGRILTIAANYQPVDEQEKLRFRDRFAGAIWEWIGYYNLREQLPYTQFLLSPEQTYLLYRNIYADRETVNNLNLNFGISNQTVPDGLIIKREEDHLSVEATVEYKSLTRMPTSYERQRIENQAVSFRNGRLSQDLRLEEPNAIDSLYHSGLINLFNPRFPKDKPLKVNPRSVAFLVLPENSSVDLFGVYNKYVPFTGTEFSTFIDVLGNFLRYNQ